MTLKIHHGCQRSGTWLLILIAPIHVLLAAEVLDAGSLSFQDRLDCAKAIEEVYWQHRIWPAQNPEAKPALDAVLSDAQIRERVTTYLQKSAALEHFWQRPLTGEQLQAEMDRMVRNTRDPGLLRELFAALDDDPLLVAECLARPVLVDRLTRNWYAYDTRFRGALREQATAALAAHSKDATAWTDLGGEYRETETRLAPDDSETTGFDATLDQHPVVDLNAGEWRRRIERLASSFNIEQESEGTDSTAARFE